MYNVYLPIRTLSGSWHTQIVKNTNIFTELIMYKLNIYVIFLLLSLNIIKSMLILRAVKPVDVLI